MVYHVFYTFQRARRRDITKQTAKQARTKPLFIVHDSVSSSLHCAEQKQHEQYFRSIGRAERPKHRTTVRNEESVLHPDVLELRPYCFWK